MVVLRWIVRLLLWLALEWVGAVVGVVFIIAGLLPSDMEGTRVIQFFQSFLGNDLARYAIVALGFALIIGAVYRNFFSYAVLRSELRQSLDDLNSDNIHVRLHAIEEILAVSRKSRHLHSRAMRVLANFVRARSPVQPQIGRSVTVTRLRLGRPTASYQHECQLDMHEYARSEYGIARRETPVDVKAAVEAISQRRRFFDDPRQWIDLSETDLPSISLEKLKVGQVSFAGSYLRHARFDGADLRGAGFDCAVVTDATFDNADLRNASFFGCLGHRLRLDGSDLRDASLSGADLYDADIQKADARRASFLGAAMWRLDGGLTNFANAEFFSANLTGASLHHAKGLTKTQIYGKGGSGAVVDKNTRLPWSTEGELQASGIVRFNHQPKAGRSWYRSLRSIVRKMLR
jgi:uncharacterized protein YjbI with pentapeptide repeats